MRNNQNQIAYSTLPVVQTAATDPSKRKSAVNSVEYRVSRDSTIPSKQLERKLRGNSCGFVSEKQKTFAAGPTTPSNSNSCGGLCCCTRCIHPRGSVQSNGAATASRPASPPFQYFSDQFDRLATKGIHRTATTTVSTAATATPFQIQSTPPTTTRKASSTRSHHHHHQRSLSLSLNSSSANNGELSGSGKKGENDTIVGGGGGGVRTTKVHNGEPKYRWPHQQQQHQQHQHQRSESETTTTPVSAVKSRGASENFDWRRDRAAHVVSRSALVNGQSRSPPQRDSDAGESVTIHNNNNHVFATQLDPSTGVYSNNGSRTRNGLTSNSFHTSDDDELIYIDSCLICDDDDVGDRYGCLTEASINNNCVNGRPTCKYCACNDRVKANNGRDSIGLLKVNGKKNTNNKNTNNSAGHQNQFNRSAQPFSRVADVQAAPSGFSPQNLNNNNNNNSEFTKNYNIDVKRVARNANEECDQNGRSFLPPATVSVSAAPTTTTNHSSTTTTTNPSDYNGQSSSSVSSCICDQFVVSDNVSSTTAAKCPPQHQAQCIYNQRYTTASGTNNKHSTHNELNNNNNNTNGADDPTLIICDWHINATTAGTCVDCGSVAAADQTAGNTNNIIVELSSSPLVVASPALAPLPSETNRINNNGVSDCATPPTGWPTNSKLTILLDNDDDDDAELNWPTALLLAEARIRENVEHQIEREDTRVNCTKSSEIGCGVADGGGDGSGRIDRLTIDSDCVDTNATPELNQEQFIYIGNKAVPVALFNRRSYRRYRRVSLDNPFPFASTYRETSRDNDNNSLDSKELTEQQGSIEDIVSIYRGHYG